MMPVPITIDAGEINLSTRVQSTAWNTTSPSAAAETVIATLTLNTDVTLFLGIILLASCAFTVGTSGTAVRLRVRRTNVSGTIVADTGALTGGVAAGNLLNVTCNDLDTGAAATGQVYVLTLTVTAGAAASTITKANLTAIMV